MDNYGTRYNTHAKGRPLPKNNFYHATYGRTYRQQQSDYAFTSSRNSALLWHDNKHIPKTSSPAAAAAPSKGKCCSIALAAATFVVLVVVLAIAGLALYMGALRTENSSPLITFVCRVKVARGDRFIVGLADKARRYRQHLENIYQRSTLGAAYVATSVDRFGNDTRTLFFRISLNRRKIPRQIYNVEKSIRDILLGDATSRKPVLPNVQFEAKSMTVKRVDADLYQTTKPTATPAKTKELPKRTLPTVPRPSPTPSIRKVTTSKLPVVEGPQGSFKISKTDADITMKNTTVTTAKPATTTKSPSVTPKLKETYVTSALFKLAAGNHPDRTTKPPTVVTPSLMTTTSTPTSEKPTTTTTIKNTSLQTEKSTKSTTRIQNPFHLFNQEPWVPIYKGQQNDQNGEPVYTSFTNQGLSWQSFDTEQLGSTRLQGHPLPVNKISDVTSPIDKIFITTSTYPQAEEVEEVEENTQVYEDVMQGLENRQGDDLELETTTHATYVEIDTIKYSPQNLTTNPQTTSSTTTERPVEVASAETNLGQAEVVDADEISLMLQTSTVKVPLVTLLPVKSNSGVGRPIRPRPNRPNTEVRSFSSTPADTTPESSSEVKYIETEVVTSISQEHHRIKTQMNNFQIVSVLNFATEIPATTTEAVLDFTKLEPQPFQQILTPEKLEELSKISKIHTNASAGVISTKAVDGAGHNFNVLTKTFNKIPQDLSKGDKEKDTYMPAAYFPNTNVSECSNYTIKCGNGQCLPNSTRCNNLVDCADGSDERDCDCADYLRSQFLLKKICDGIVDCWDFSDENRCEWCTPGQYVCANSKMCIDRVQICDGTPDCPWGDDERQCVTVAPSSQSADEFSYHSDGYLMVRKGGAWGKLCVHNFPSVAAESRVRWEVADLGQAVCKAMTYLKLDSTKIIKENTLNSRYEPTPYYELTFSHRNQSKSSLSFEATTCENKQVVVVKCESLECGVRPQIGKKTNARIVGGGNAGLGAWPWQAALYKEGEFQCGGTLISDKWILSAGHCFFHSQKDHWVARLGNLRRGTALPSPYEQLRPISRIILHPDYVDVGFINDISLLRMTTAVVFSDYVRPICLPPAGMAPGDGRTCTVIGWGQLFEIGRIFPDTLQEVQVPIISTAECRKRTVFLPLYQVTDNMFCAGYDRGGRDACLGDSGGPLMCAEADGRWTLHGITSNGYGCARAFRPGVYTKVANYIEWLSRHVYGVPVVNDTTAVIADGCNGHRCPLGECLPKSRICNGFIECSDGSDERDCLKTAA